MATGGSEGGQAELSRKRQAFRTGVAESLDELSEEEIRETERALYEYVFRRAEKDEKLSRDEVESFREAEINKARKESTSKEAGEVEGGGGGGESNAQAVGRRLAELGDEIDSMYSGHFEDIMQMYSDNPDQAFVTFSTVLQNVFEWDEFGLPKLNIGRIAAVLGYCYHLCKNYISKYFSSSGLLSFLAVLAGFLVKFFLKAKFYDLLKRVGGWGHLIQVPAASVVSRVVSAPNFFLVVGVASLAIYAFQYFRGR